MNPRDMMAMQMAGGGAPPMGGPQGGPPPGPMGPEPDGDEMGGQFPPELIEALAMKVVELLQQASGGGAPGGQPPMPGGMA